MGLLSLAAKKSHDVKRLYVTGPSWSLDVPVDRKEERDAEKFAEKVNRTARALQE